MIAWLVDWCLDHGRSLATGFAGLVIVALILFAAYSSYEHLVLGLRGERATATCTSYEVKTSGTSSERRRVWTYYFRFQTASGEPVEGSLVSSKQNIAANDRVDILYDPQQPTRICLDSLISVWGFPVFFGCVGLLLVWLFYKAKALRKLDRQLDRR
ncbi:DUF3592 domain-containing protein [Bremerella sp. P1]|uniref:DUF3592 domain-containing protein n=1 Tax=Bremerella sp. P1 TaxID=3026424 RepID=UPI003FCDEEC8